MRRPWIFLLVIAAVIAAYVWVFVWTGDNPAPQTQTPPPVQPSSPPGS